MNQTWDTSQQRPNKEENITIYGFNQHSDPDTAICLYKDHWVGL